MTAGSTLHLGTKPRGPKLGQRLDSEDGGVVDPGEEHGDVMAGQILIGGFPRPLPAEIVVHNQNTTWSQSWVKMVQFSTGRRIPVGVEPKERDTARRWSDR